MGTRSCNAKQAEGQRCLADTLKARTQLEPSSLTLNMPPPPTDTPEPAEPYLQLLCEFWVALFERADVR